jgi:hypothetical protein
MACGGCGSAAVSERSERTARGYRRFRCRACGKQLNERNAGSLNRTKYPSDVVAPRGALAGSVASLWCRPVRWKPWHDETTTGNAGTARSGFQGSAIHR